MRIALYCTHEGLKRMMKDLLSDHEVIIYNNSVYDSEPTKIATEEVIISTFPYKELEHIPLNKKIIVYATDPFPNPGVFVQFSEYGNITVIGDGDGIDVYPKIIYPINSKIVLPHSINPDNYPKFKGDINAIAICQRKPFERWAEVTGGAFERLVPLSTYLRDIPYHILHVPDNKDFFETISHYKGVFYYSNNPYTLMMFELMAMNMPMVAFDSARYGGRIMRRYLHRVSNKEDEVRGWLKELIKTPAPEIYKLNDFQDTKKKWNEVIKQVYERK